VLMHRLQGAGSEDEKMPAPFYDRRRAWRPFLQAIGNQPDAEKLSGHFSMPRSVRSRIAKRLQTAEAIKAAEYILDRTYGHKEYWAQITQREFLYGRVLKNGKHEDGCGIHSFRKLALALLECEEAGVIRITHTGKGRGARTIYEPILPDAVSLEQQAVPPAQVKRPKAPRLVRSSDLAAHVAPTSKAERPHMQRPMPAPIDNSPLAALLTPLCEQWKDGNIPGTIRYAREQGAGLSEDTLLAAVNAAISHAQEAIARGRATNPIGLLSKRIALEMSQAQRQAAEEEASRNEQEHQWAAILAIPLSEKAQRAEAQLRERNWPPLVIPNMRLFSGEEDWQWLLHLNQDETLLDELLMLLAPDLSLSSAEQAQGCAVVCSDSSAAIHKELMAPLETESLAPVEDAPIREEASSTEPECPTDAAPALPGFQRPGRSLLPRWRQEQEALWKEAEEQDFPVIEISSDGEGWLKIAGFDGWQHFKETSSSFEQDRARIKLRQLRRSMPRLLVSLVGASGDSGERSGV